MILCCKKKNINDKKKPLRWKSGVKLEKILFSKPISVVISKGWDDDDFDIIIIIFFWEVKKKKKNWCLQYDKSFLFVSNNRILNVNS